MITKHTLWLLLMSLPFVCLSALQLACNSKTADNSLGSASVTTVRLDSEDNVVKAKLSTDFSNFSLNRITKPIGDRVEFASFVSEKYGWLIGGYKLYSTDDGGTTWQRHQVPVKKDGKIVYVKRVSRSEGWIAVQTNIEKYGFSQNDRVDLFKTQDGGLSFDLMLSEKSVTFVDAYFDELHGMIIGNRFTGDPLLRHRPYLKTFENDRWNDGSETLELFLENEFGHFRLLDKIDFYSRCFDVVTDKLEIVRTCDDSHDWITVFRRPIVQNPLGVMVFSRIDRARSWILESTGGFEGSGTRISHLDVEIMSNDIIILQGVFARLGFRLTEENEILVVDDLEVEEESRTNSIIVSSDRGRMWNSVRDSRTNSTYIYGFVTSQNRGRLVTSDGSILELEDH